MWTVLLLVFPAALAAGVPEPEVEPPAPMAIPAPPPVPVVPLARDLAWEPRAPLPEGEPPAAVAVEPGRGWVWLAVDTAGTVFRSGDAGVSWSSVLPSVYADSGLDDEARLAEAAEIAEAEAASAEDLIEAEDLEEGDTVELDVEELDADLAEDAIRVLDTLRVAPTVGGGAVRVWFDPEDGERALVGRPDGTWRSEDGGQSWTQVERRHAPTVFARVSGALVAAGDGLLVSLDDGRSWIEVEGIFRDIVVHGLAVDAGTVWAATEAGLLRSEDALRWTSVAAAGDGPVAAVVVDPDWAGGLWIARGDALLRSDDGGASFAPLGRQPLPDLRRLVHLGEPGHLLAVSGVDGVWESLDGGVRWQPVVRGLTDPRVMDVGFVGKRPVIATTGGIWELVSVRESVEATPARGLDLSDTVGLALSRTGLDLDPVSLAGRAAAYRLTPKLVLQGYWAQRRSRDADYVDLDTTEANDRTWFATTQLCWGACDTLITYSDGDDLESLAEDELAGQAELYVLGDEIYLDDDPSTIAAAANLTEATTRYRVSLADRVAGAWLARSRLVHESALRADAPLREQVMAVLAVAELEARLDGWTGGAFTRSLSGESP